MARKPISVLIVDDSAVVRVTLETLLTGEPEIGHIDTAADPYVAAERMRKHAPDVIILDLQMPRMDGITFLRKLMDQHPLPVVVCSAHVGEGSEAALEALESGAVDLIAKPAAGTRRFLEESRDLVVDAVRAAAAARVDRRGRPLRLVAPKLSVDEVVPRAPRVRARRGRGARIIAMGASTGGTEALRSILGALPADVPGIVVVQHMPAHFTYAFARRLDQQCRPHVKEAEDGERVLPGHVYIAPGGERHMTIEREGDGYRVRLLSAARVNRHRPSADVLFRSLAAQAGPAAVGALLTGMGDDGAAGLLEMRQAGAHTIAQDEESCVVFGMPAAAIRRGGVDEVLGLDGIAERLTALTRA